MCHYTESAKKINWQYVCDTVSYSQDIPEDGKVRCTPVHNHQYSATLKNEKAYEALRGSSALHRVSKTSLKSSLKLS
jgi:hypothetical protein